MRCNRVVFSIKQQKIKPFCVKKYSENVDLVDKYDMQISFSEYIRRSPKWYKKGLLSLDQSHNL
jgi:hypothetical protein